MSPEQVEQAIARANEARSILASPVYVDSMNKMKKEIIDTWAACPARDKDGREWLWQQYQVALKFEESLAEVLNTGKIALQEKELSLVEKGRRFVARYSK
jgi:tRNA C32,U32 (ribose-2'-O)-methylase TrmJ